MPGSILRPDESMAGLIPQSFIDDLLNRTDILDVVSSRIQLKKTGKNYSACCPFHKEKTPSFTVSPDKQFYYCFGCGAGGNALGFIMDHDNLDFVQAVEDLAKRAGMDIPREEGRRGKPRQPTDSPLYPLLSAAADYYRQALKSHPARKAAVEYLKGRGLTGEIARDFGLGFAPPGWDNLLKHLGGDNLQLKAMLDAGLLVENPDSGKRYDRFRDRVIFPIRDSRGRVIAFGGRVLGDDKPKYLNSPETPVFHKGQELYGLFEARKNNRDLDEIMVVEGYMDVIALAQQGIRNAVATLGTATSEEHIKRLFRLVPNILFCFDGDQAGRKAAWRALESALPNLQDGRKIRFLFLPEGEDPDSLVRAEGPDAFRARLAHQAQPLADYFFQQLMQEADPSTLEGKAHLATLAGPLLEKIPGNTLRLLMRQRLGQLTGLSGEALNQLNAPRSSSDSGSANHIAFGLTTPLLTTASGAKMGKTASGAVWLNADMLSPYDYWQYWRNAEDRDVGRFLRLFTELPLDEIARLEALQGAEINDAKKVLADEATRLLHGEDAAKTARDTAQKAFEQGVLSADLPTVEIPAADLRDGIMLAALATRIGLTASNGEARRLAQGGGLRVNDAAIHDGNQPVTEADLNPDGVIKIAQGKKKIFLIKPV